MGIGDRGLGIGERGSEHSVVVQPFRAAEKGRAEALRYDDDRGIGLRIGYDDTRAFETLACGDDGAFLVHSEALGRIELDLVGPARLTDYPTSLFELRRAGGRRTRFVSELPIGSTFDAGRGVFTWQPGPGFLGEHALIFMRGSERLVVRITIGGR